MEEAPENGKKSSHSAHANGIYEWNLNLQQKLLEQEKICKMKITVKNIQNKNDLQLSFVKISGFSLNLQNK